MANFSGRKSRDLSFLNKERLLMRNLGTLAVLAAFAFAPQLWAQDAKPDVSKLVDIEEDIEYGKAGDRKLLLDMVRPKAESVSPRSVVVYIHGGGWRGVSKVNTFQELMDKYDASGTDCMVLQEYIPFDHYVRSYCIGKKEVCPMPYDPVGQRYLFVDDYLDPQTEDRVRRETILINEALGYDINTVEFAILDGEPYAIDYMNPAPDADWWSVGTHYFKWMVEKVADLAIETALRGEPTLKHHRWDDLLKSDIKRAGAD